MSPPDQDRLKLAPQSAAWLDGLEIAIGGDWKPGLDDIDTHFIERLGHLELFFQRHGRAGRLLAITQSGVENEDAFFVAVDGH